MPPTHIPGIPYGPLPKVATVSGILTRPRILVLHDTGHLPANRVITSAADEAHYAATRTDPQRFWTSAHAYIDEDGPLGSTPLGTVAWAAYGWANHHGLHFEMCGMDPGVTGAVPIATVEHTARLMSRVADIYGIRKVKLTPTQVAAAQTNDQITGFCGHYDITVGLHVGDHDDPGKQFDWPRFMALTTAKPLISKKGDNDMSYLTVPEGVAFNADSSWLDPTKAIAVPVPKVGVADVDPGAWGPAWIWLASNQTAVVRVLYDGGGFWDGRDVHLDLADSAQLIPLPTGTTKVFVGYKSGAGATFMIHGSR